ncbi:efflux RND transporter permease subunit [Piscibacillus halophilus]|uniref:efflux RND transporter permease subunit n=1 Tax=Piscibacillus halophilus TaxID=571933 RepID=UPI00240955E1|nr:efflux RND transporter permease subunit [Piscibacillus halophilus]
MKLIEFLLNRKILVGLVTVLVFLVGGYAILKLDQELLPNVELDAAYVYAYADDLPATEVERSITVPLEQELEGIDGVETIESTTYYGMSQFQILIEEGRGSDVYQDIESSVYSKASEINEISSFMSGQLSTDQGYEFFMDLSGDDLKEVTQFALNTFEPRLESLPEINDVSFEGGFQEEVLIAFDQDALADYNLDAHSLLSVIEQANTDSTLGEFNEADQTSILRWPSNIQSLEDIESISVPTESGFIELDDVADVSIQDSTQQSMAWKNGSQDFMLVQISRNKDFTQIEMADAVRQEIQAMEDEGLFQDVIATEVVSQADYAEDALSGVSQNILIGGLLALVVLLIFLRNVRATIIIGVTIPASILLTFTAMWLLDYSFNILSLIGLGLGIGMMVDSSIVILESIYRQKEKGIHGMEAVLKGVKEVATAVMASMLTTIVVFLPMGLVGGDIGSFMIVLSLVVAATLISSVIVAFTIIPSLADRFLKIKDQKQNKDEGKIIGFYGRLVNWVVRKKMHSLAIVALFIFMLIGSSFLVSKIPMTIMPDVFNRYTEMIVTPEQGISPSEKETIVQELNDRLMEVEDVEANYMIDDGSYIIALVNMTKGDDITREQADINADISNSLREAQDQLPIQNIQSTVSGTMGSAPAQINIKGEDFTELRSIAQNLSQEIESIDGIVGLSTTIDSTSSEDVIELNEDAIDESGLISSQVRQYISESFLEVPLGEATINGDKLAVQAGWANPVGSKEDLLNRSVLTPQGEQELSELVSINTVEVPSEIKRIDGERTVTINADIEGTDLGTVNREVQEIVNEYDLPEGYSISVAGDLEQQQELMMEMLMVLGMAIFLVYLVMAVQFNHLVHPLIVMSVLPVTVIGVILGLFFTQQELSAMSAMGIIMLIGIVLNNAILLIDRTNQLRREGFTTSEALVEAGKNRIRPIFMTSFTTAAGMLPLALATGSAGNYQAPMATVIISGLLFATLITLLLIPAVYRIFTSKKADKRMKEKIQDQDQAVKTA